MTNSSFKPKNSSFEWRITALLGLALSILGLFMMPMFPQLGHIVLSGFGGPVFAFETARDLADLINVFGPLDDPLRATRITQMDLGNKWDFPFMAIYSFFIAAFLYASKASLKPWKLLVSIALLSGVMDAWENIILLGLTADLEGQRLLSYLPIPVYAKFISIMLTTVAAGVVMVRQHSAVWRVLGVLVAAGALTILPALITPESYGWLIRHGITIAWTLMLFFAVARSVKKNDKYL